MTPASSGPRVDIYVLQGDHPQTLYRTVCRLTEKAFGMGHRIYIHAASQGESLQLDDLLWTFRDGSFLPHARHPAPSEDRSPILIGHDDQDPQSDRPQDDWSVLINLADQTPAFFHRFPRVAEVVDEDPHRRTAGRRRYLNYKEHGLNPIVHKLG